MGFSTDLVLISEDTACSYVIPRMKRFDQGSPEHTDVVTKLRSVLCAEKFASYDSIVVTRVSTYKARHLSRSQSSSPITHSMRVCRTLPTRLSTKVLPRIPIRKIFFRPASTNMSLFTPRSMQHGAPGFSSLFRMLDDFEKYAHHYIPSSMGGSMIPSSSSIETCTPKFDVAEHDKNYTLQGELPGVPPENVNIEFTDPQTLVVSGHAEREHTEGDPSLAKGMIEERGSKKNMEGKKGESKEDSGKTKYWLRERSFGEFSRVFSFPTSVDQDKVEAKFNHGVLDITVPKMEKKGTHKIEIK